MIRSRRGARALLISLVGLLAVGCSPGSILSSAPTAQVIDRGGTDIVSEPGSRDSTFFKGIKAAERVCRAPGPDFARTASEGFSLDFGLPVAGAGDIGEDASKGALGLGGRDPEVLITREMMYRACELSLNLDADPKTTRAIYARFLKAINALGITQTGKGAAAASAAPTAAPAANASAGGSGNSGGF